ncbi:ribonuclease H-like domain-containing protein, partial [Polychytrium aggregatum]|uniref:ribonuclease H-like domain-containing protein n=1 Tax=Polychytrium aggregatum TaxID=110093 RepID=UPI0022FEFB5C
MEGKHKTPVPPIEPATFDDFSKSFFASLVQCTKAAQFLKAEELPFYKANSSEFATSLEHTSESVLSLCNRLMRHASKGFGVDSSGSDLVGVGFEDVDDMVDRFDAVVDVVDNLLEKADVCFDEVLGTAGQRGAASVPTQSSPMVVQMSVGGSRNQKKDVTVVHAQNIIRPQLKFEDKIDNSNRPFVRKLAVKHNALRPLDYGLSSSGLISDEMAAHLNLPHPYQYEIENISYPERMFKQSPEILYSSLDETPLTYIDTKEQLMAALPIIESASELAIDLEHHDYRSFQGFVCLMQISTRSEDFIIDTLAVRSYMHLLNQALSDPQIIKVFHGAESDIIWLQRDFGVYVVNMFDTYHASHLLECSAHSLAHLLKTYCDVATDKKYQLADWRIRPIPAEMLKYARIDTHYLLYIYDRMRNELIEQGNPSTHNLMHAVLQRSKVTSLNLYQKEIYDFESGEGPGGWRKPLESYGFSMNAEQLAVFKAVHAWRDHTAREEDESTRYVCPMHMLYAIADRMPTDSAGVLSCCNPVPPLVRMYASDIALLIERTRTEA